MKEGGGEVRILVFQSVETNEVRRNAFYKSVFVEVEITPQQGKAKGNKKTYWIPTEPKT